MLDQGAARWHRQALPIVVACSMAGILASPPPAQARKAALDDSNKELLGAASGLVRQGAEAATRDGALTIDKWLSSAQALNDYQFNYSMTVYKKSPVTEQGKLAYKKVHLLRIEETGGPKAGSVAVLEKDGKVHGHLGGAMKFFNATLSPDSNMLKSANGWPMVKSDYISLAEAVEGYIKQDQCTAKVTENPVTVGAHPSPVLDWFLYHPDGTLFKRALFDTQTGQPVEWWDYVNGKLFAHSVWTNFKTNVGLSDKLFTL
jgi:outer membrane lipoprotein-sorting protein